MERRDPTHSRKRPEHYPGYPAERLTLDLSDEQSLQGVPIPDGPWEIHGQPLPTIEVTQQAHEAGYQTDASGRPLHPWARLLLSSEHGGTPTGKGAYWHWGPNKTADPIVITSELRPRILLIERSDTGMLALPGGFIDQDEDPLACARRELEEETGLELSQEGTLVYQGPVADLRTTLHAWAETSAYLFTVETPSKVRGNDDAISAKWYFLDELPNTLFGSHADLVKMALKTTR